MQIAIDQWDARSAAEKMKFLVENRLFLFGYIKKTSGPDKGEPESVVFKTYAPDTVINLAEFKKQVAQIKKPALAK